MKSSAALLLGFAITLASSALAEPRRVASANLCADQLLMALADPDQIASLSPLSRDPSISFLSDKAAKFPINRASGEDLVHADADLVLIGPFDSRYTRFILDTQKIPMAVLDPWTSLDMGRQQIRDLAARLNRSDRGKDLVAEIDRGLDRLPRVSFAERPSFLMLHRRGFVHHAGLTSEILARAGLRDASADLGIGDYGFVRLESLVKAPPDFLVVDDEAKEPDDNGQAFLVHPALLKLWPMSRRLVAPGRSSICGGPSTPHLIEALSQQIKMKVLSSKR